MTFLALLLPIADAAGLARPALDAGIEGLGVKGIAMPPPELCSNRDLRPRIANRRSNRDARGGVDWRHGVDVRGSHLLSSHLLDRHFLGLGLQFIARPPGFAVAIGFGLNRNRREFGSWPQR